MSDQPILIERPEPGVGLIRLNRPAQRNALNQASVDAIEAALRAFEADDSIHAVVITGSEKFFAAGADVSEFKGLNGPAMLAHGEHRWAQWEYLRSYRKPLIAAVCGWCLGGGNELAMMCDLIIAGENAQFGQPEINLALIPGAGGTQRLIRAVGKAIASEMTLAGRFLSAREALSFNLINAVVPPELALRKAIEVARRIAEKSPLAVRLAKEALQKAFELPLSEGLRAERRNYYLMFSSKDKEEGIAAFLEKRDPHWKGE